MRCCPTRQDRGLSRMRYSALAMESFSAVSVGTSTIMFDVPARQYPSRRSGRDVHSYSLIHDDLPAMDDDNMRMTGPPSKAFDENDRHPGERCVADAVV